MIKRSSTTLALTVVGLLWTPVGPVQAGEPGTAEDIVDAMTELFGSHKAFRTVHAKGFCAAGSFQATPEAADISKAAIFDGRAVPVMYRFSLGSGLPTASDREPAARSLVVRFEPAGAGTMDLLMINSPIVFARNATDFADFFRAVKPDPATGKPNSEKLKAFLDAHPEAARFLEVGAKIPVPVSYATARYFAVHAFYFINAKGERRAARWIAEPAAGVVGITDEMRKALTDDFYAEELRKRVEKAPVEWDLYLQFAEPGDPVDDPTALWPDNRKTVKVGRLRVGSVEPEGSKGPCDAEMFDPTSLLDGIEASNDPILKLRPEGYAISFSRRTSQ